MFHTFMTLATLITTGAHAVFGCCWHHDHDHHPADRQVVQATEHPAVAESPCGCQHACHQDHGEHSPIGDDASVTNALDSLPCGHSEDHESPGSCEDRCQFFGTAKVKLPALDHPNGLAGLFFGLELGGVFAVRGHGLPMLSPLASPLSGSLCVRDVTQIARI